MNNYSIAGQQLDSVELKCMLVSCGVKVDSAVYKSLDGVRRLSVNPMCCNCLILSDGTICQLTDLAFHLKLLSGILSWDKLKLLKYASDLDTPFSLRLVQGAADVVGSAVAGSGGGAGGAGSGSAGGSTAKCIAASAADGQGPAEADEPQAAQTATVGLYYKKQLLDTVGFPPYSQFYRQKTASGKHFTGNAVIQGLDWVAFQCLWPCEYAAAGKACEFCFSGADFEALAKKGKAQPAAFPAEDLADVVAFAVREAGVRHLQITGGSTFDGATEYRYIRDYLQRLAQRESKEPGAALTGEKLLYITPPADNALLDEYFSLGASRIACSLELWDMPLASSVTAGKVCFTSRERHLQALQYVADNYGPGRAFSNFIIGIEPFETLAAGARYLAERGVMPTASVWMPMGRPVQGSMRAPELDYYRRVKELFAELYTSYGLEPTNSRGLNVCVERDIYNWAML